MPCVNGRWASRGSPGPVRDQNPKRADQSPGPSRSGPREKAEPGKESTALFLLAETPPTLTPEVYVYAAGLSKDASRIFFFLQRFSATLTLDGDELRLELRGDD